MRWLRTVAIPFLLVPSMAGCLKPDPNPRFQPAWEPFDPGDEAWLTTREALLVADCQIHNLWSDALPDRNLSIKALAATSIRPPQLDLFATDVLGWILQHGAPEADVVLHLGDAADLGCEGEFASFVEVMESSSKPWFMCPGNHDFFYLGSYDPDDDVLKAQACQHAGVLLSKDRFIRLYVATLVRQREPGCDRLARELGLDGARDQSMEEIAESIPESFRGGAWDEDGGFLRRIAWSIDTSEPWRSFIIQEIELTDPDYPHLRKNAVLLDSCQYQRRPILITNAWKSWPIELNCGATGEMLPDQLRLVREWFELEPERWSIVACHHPFDGLAPRTKSSLGWLWRETRMGGLVTAHTHKGYFAPHDLGDEEEYLELNIASTTDWPMEWRTLRSYIDPETRTYYERSTRHTLKSSLQYETGFFERGWEVGIGAPDDYRGYNQGQTTNALLVDFALAYYLVPYWLPPPHVRANAAARQTESKVKDTLLWTYFRLLELFPTDVARHEPAWPAGCSSDGDVGDRIGATVGEEVSLDAKIDLLRQLKAFERSRRSCDPDTGEPDDDARAAFKISSAVWASRFEYSHGRRLEVEDELIRVRWTDQMTRRAAGLQR